MLLFRPPLLRFGLAGVSPPGFPVSDEASPLANDLPDLADRDQAEWLWALLPPLPASGTTQANDSGGYALIEPADGTYTQGYRGLVMPLAGDPVVYESTITINVGEIVEPPVDEAPPVMSGTLSVTGLTSTSYTVSYAAASDNVAVTGYERSLDGGGSWLDVGNALSVLVAGRAPGSTDSVRVRAYDAAGNRSTPLATSVTLPDAPIDPPVEPPAEQPPRGVMSAAAYFQMMRRAAG